MLNIVVVFGGVSCEHDISIITAEQLISRCDCDKFNIIPIYIDKSGNWFTGKELLDIDNFKDNLHKCRNCTILPNDKSLYIKKGKKYVSFALIDVAIICMHGKNGEDGALAGLMELSQIPYTCCDVCSSSVCIDKVCFKYLCKGIDVPCVDGFLVSESEILLNKDDVCDKINKLGYPIILKPSRLGSSIGIKVCKSENELISMLNDCFRYDRRVLVEKFIDVNKEINIALFDDKGEIIFSNTEEPVRNDEILSFDEKYRKNSGNFENIKRVSPAVISTELEDRIKYIAKNCYIEFGLFGVVRFDFILDKNLNLYINEINTIPGSMANYLFDKSVYSYPKLIELMVSNAIHRRKLDDRLIKTIDTDVLENDFDGFKK